MYAIESSDAPAWAGMAEALAGVGYWRMESATQRIQWSPNMYRKFGFEPGAAPSLDEAMGRVHPEDRLAADENLASDMAGDSSRLRRAVRIVWPSGEIRHIEGCTHSVRDAKGSVVAVVGAVLDVTDRKRAEAALLEAKERAEDAVAEKSAFVANVTTNCARRSPQSSAILSCWRRAGRQTRAAWRCSRALAGRFCRSSTTSSTIRGSMRVAQS